MSRRLDIVRECYRAYETGDRDLIERHLADGYTFFSPADPGIGLDAYWERCWPNAVNISGFDEVRLVEAGDEVLMTYEATRADGTRFRNTEVHTFAGDELIRSEVYFGWELTRSS